MDARALLVLATVLALSGCLGLGGGTPTPVSTPQTGTPTPTATPAPSATAASADTTTPASQPTPTTPAIPFGVSIDSVTDCGETCRDVNATLTNQRAAPVSNVSVGLRMFAGNGTDGRVVWTATETVGTLGAGESISFTRRVELSNSEALAVRSEDGWVTFRATVRSDGETVTVTRRRQAG